LLTKDTQIYTNTKRSSHCVVYAYIARHTHARGRYPKMGHRYESNTTDAACFASKFMSQFIAAYTCVLCS